MAQEEWLDEVRSKAIENGKPKRSILIYVHGYNNNFTNAAESLARLSTGFDDGVVPILYTWPSRNTLAGYPADENEVERSAKYFADLLFWLRSAIPEAEIEIVAHSMGNRVVVGGIELLAGMAKADRSQSEKLSIKAVALFAADVDRDTYTTRYSFPVNESASRVLIYVSAKDRALAASRKFHDADPRLGQNDPEPYTDKKAETIDATDARTDFLGHGYFIGNRAVINDLAYALGEDIPAYRRRGLKGIPNRLAPKYWWLLVD